MLDGLTITTSEHYWPDSPPKAATPWSAALGNAAVPQRHAHSQAPPVLMVPVPDTMDPELDETIEVAAGGAMETELAVPPVMEEVPPVMGEAVPVPFWAMAIAWNIAWVLFAVGLIENVIPFPQWPDCLQ
jgi:hypothetical protein